jgi:hypothetical protein
VKIIWFANPDAIGGYIQPGLQNLVNRVIIYLAKDQNLALLPVWWLRIARTVSQLSVNVPPLTPVKADPSASSRLLLPGYVYEP